MIPSPLVTVVIPTRNRARLLGLTLRSVLRQQEVAFEVIVVDEGSTDDTPAMLAGLGDGRIRVIRHEIPQGVSSARNRGTADARGNWVAFVDDDDLWAPDKLIRQLHAAEAVGSHWAYAGAVSITDGGEIIDGSAPLPPEQMIAALLRHNAIPGGGSNVIVQRTSLERAGTFDSRLDPCEDWDMWIRLGRAGPPAWVCSPLVAYRVHSSNASLNVAAVVRSVRLIESRHGTTIDWEGCTDGWPIRTCDAGSGVPRSADSPKRLCAVSYRAWLRTCVLSYGADSGLRTQGCSRNEDDRKMSGGLGRRHG